jgi:hypothetical protein
VHLRWRWASEQGSVAGRGRRGATRLTSGVGRQQAQWSAAGCGRKREKRGSAPAGHRQAGPGHTVPRRGSNSVLN